MVSAERRADRLSEEYRREDGVFTNCFEGNNGFVFGRSAMVLAFAV